MQLELNHLIDRKATLILINTMGMPIVHHVTLKRAAAEIKNGKTTAVTATYVLRGKRKPIATRFASQPFAIGLEWQDIKGAFNSVEDGEWESFDDDVFQVMLSQLQHIEVMV